MPQAAVCKGTATPLEVEVEVVPDAEVVLLLSDEL